jgi:hypothetical protein
MNVYLAPTQHAALGRVRDSFDRSNVSFGDFELWRPTNRDPADTAAVISNGVLALADEALADRPGFDDDLRLVRVDFPALLAEGLPDPDYIDFPYLPRYARVWAFGAAQSVKTMFFQWLTAKLTRSGSRVVFVSQENPLATDLDRLARLRPEFDNLSYFHMPGLDLAERSHFVELALACDGHDLLVIDTLSASWSGDEASNADVVRLDREVLSQLVRLTGVTLVVVHHTGHPQAFVNRSGVGAGRGASAMGQKADVVLVFRSEGHHEFTVEHSKNRTPGGYLEPKARFRVIDTEDGGLDIERVGRSIDERQVEAMDAAVAIIAASDGALSTNALKAALNAEGFGGSTVTPALAELRVEEPPRVRQVDGRVVGADGKRRRGRPWIVCDG